MGNYQRALAAGDVDAIVAAFEPDGYAREPWVAEHVHRGSDGLRSFYERCSLTAAASRWSTAR